VKRPVLTRDQNGARIAGEGSKAAKAKFAASRDLIRERMRDIESDIERNDGVYPYAQGKVSSAEVLRRAGKSEAYLRKKEPPELVELKDEVEDWVVRVTKAMAAGAKVVRRKITERVEHVRGELAQVRQNYIASEILLSETQADLGKAEKKIEELEARNAALLRELADKTVVDLPTRRK
jgi:septation ring formation regulator EzrA